MALGAEGLCPTCERPLEGQRDLLIKKYENSAAYAKAEKEKLAAGIAAQTEKIEGATRSRSNLRAAFDELNAQKSRRSALQADLKSLAMQMHESQTEIKEISTRIEGLGTVSFDAGKLDQVEAALKALGPLVLEYAGLSQRLEDLPGLEVEIAQRAEGAGCSKGEAGAAHRADTGPGLRRIGLHRCQKAPGHPQAAARSFSLSLGEGGTNSRLKGEDERARARDREARPGPEGSANLAKGSGLQSAGV